MDGAVQHDAHELNRLLIDALERSLKNTPGEQLCPDLYAGQAETQIRCTVCNNVSSKAEPFYDMQLQVTGCADFSASMRVWSAAETLEGETAYECDTCKTKTCALRAPVLNRLPHVLTLSCNRFRIDATTNWQRQKLTGRTEFPLVLDMSVYAEGGTACLKEVAADPEVEKRYLASLRDHMVWSDTAISDARDVAADLLARPQYREAAEAGDVRAIVDGLGVDELRSIVARLRTPADPASPLDGPGLYNLFAVIMHRGSAHSGHYFAYIKDELNEVRLHPHHIHLIHAREHACSPSAPSFCGRGAGQVGAAGVVCVHGRGVRPGASVGAARSRASGVAGPRSGGDRRWRPGRRGRRREQQ